MNPSKDSIEHIKHGYDSAAPEYSKLFFDELERKAFDRYILCRFSELTRNHGTVCDIGCGPGEVASFLKAYSTDVIGTDISPEMLKQASILSPGTAFFQGNMFNLSLKSDSLAGIAAFYAIVNYSIDTAAAAFEEFYRVLRKNGSLLIAFHTGQNKKQEVSNFLDSNVNLDFWFFDMDDMLARIAGAGFSINEAVVRYPYPSEYPTKRAYILAEK